MGTAALGEFEQLVLLAIAHLDDDAYGTTIRREIGARTGKVIAIGALYTALERLELKGCVGSTLSDPTPQRGGRAKRLFRLERCGITALKRSRETLESTRAGLSPDFKPGRR